MPDLFLSPSTQEYNPYIDGGNEEYYMNLIADAMEPYLREQGISFERNDPALGVGSSVAMSNARPFRLHLAIHSNASPAESAGKNRGVQIYYYSSSSRGKRAANIFAENYRLIYPEPDLVRIIPTTTLYELKRTVAPAILIETAFHDNRSDASWIRNNIEEIAENLVLSTVQYLRQ